jgi:hypothetical protein
MDTNPLVNELKDILLSVSNFPPEFVYTNRKIDDPLSVFVGKMILLFCANVLVMIWLLANITKLIDITITVNRNPFTPKIFKINYISIIFK